MRLLRECLTALRAQTRHVNEVLVVDNASRDGTAEMIAREYPEVRLLTLPYNSGGAGGFHEGIRKAMDGHCDWFWLMDDDTIATPTALEEALAPLASLNGLPAPAVIASKVLWTTGELHPMNLPWPRWKPYDVALNAAERGLFPMRAASFVSVLVRRTAVAREGLPLKHYFIWGDDIEYTARLLRRDVGYLVPRSVAYHKTSSAKPSSLSSGRRYFFDVRNKVYMIRGQAFEPAEKLKYGLVFVGSVLEFLKFNRFRPMAVRTVVRGLVAGLFSRAE